MMIRSSAMTAALLAAMGLSACGQGDAPEPAGLEGAVLAPEQVVPEMARATLQTADGSPAGTATLTTHDDGAVMIQVRAQNLSPGPHGMHLHMTGRCEGPAFESAGDHWNPTNTQHGLDNPAGPHGGDMPNLMVGNDGTARAEHTLPAGSFQSLMDADGAALIIHAGEDDQTTDPSGDSGDPIACGAFQR